MNIRARTAFGVLFLSAVFAGCASPHRVQNQPAGGPPQGPVTRELVQEMVAAMKAMPGCLGVELAGTQAGKRTIMAWFVNKAALLAWYNHQVHRKAMDQVELPEENDNRNPLDGVRDDSGPLLAIAAMAVGPNGQDLSIEVYEATTAGANWGNFAPAKVHELAKAKAAKQ